MALAPHQAPHGETAGISHPPSRSCHSPVAFVLWEDMGPIAPQPTQVAASASNVSK